MKRMLLALLTVASVTVSAGVAMADAVCSPLCGLVTPAQAQNVKETEGKKIAVQHMSEQGKTYNNANIGKSSGGGGPIPF